MIQILRLWRTITRICVLLDLSKVSINELRNESTILSTFRLIGLLILLTNIAKIYGFLIVSMTTAMKTKRRINDTSKKNMAILFMGITEEPIDIKKRERIPRMEIEVKSNMCSLTIELVDNEYEILSLFTVAILEISPIRPGK